MRSSSEEAVPYLKALILLQLELLRDQEMAEKPEVLLQRAGLGITEIADLLNKNYQATAKVISRAKVGSHRRPIERGVEP